MSLSPGPQELSSEDLEGGGRTIRSLRTNLGYSLVYKASSSQGYMENLSQKKRKANNNKTNLNQQLQQNRPGKLAPWLRAKFKGLQRPLVASLDKEHMWCTVLDNT